MNKYLQSFNHITTKIKTDSITPKLPSTPQLSLSLSDQLGFHGFVVVEVESLVAQTCLEISMHLRMTMASGPPYAYLLGARITGVYHCAQFYAGLGAEARALCCSVSTLPTGWYSLTSMDFCPGFFHSAQCLLESLLLWITYFHHHIQHTAEQKSVVYKRLDLTCKSQKQNSSLARLILVPVHHSNASLFCTGPQDSWLGFNSPMSPHSEWSSHPTVIMQMSQMESQDVIYRTCHALLLLHSPPHLLSLLLLLLIPSLLPLSFRFDPEKISAQHYRRKIWTRKSFIWFLKRSLPTPGRQISVSSTVAVSQ